MTTPVPAQPSVLDAVVTQVAAGSPATLYHQADLFDQAAARLRDSVDQLRHQLRYLSTAWQGAGSDGYLEQANVVSNRVDAVIQSTQSPSYGTLLRQSGDALAATQQRLTDLQVQRAQSTGDPATDAAFYDYQAQQALAGLSNSFGSLGSQLGPLPGVAATGTPVSTGGQVAPLATSIESPDLSITTDVSGDAGSGVGLGSVGSSGTPGTFVGGTTAVGYSTGNTPAASGNAGQFGWSTVNLAGGAGTDVVSMAPGRFVAMGDAAIHHLDSVVNGPGNHASNAMFGITGTTALTLAGTNGTAGLRTPASLPSMGMNTQRPSDTSGRKGPAVEAAADGSRETAAECLVPNGVLRSQVTKQTETKKTPTKKNGTATTELTVANMPTVTAEVAAPGAGFDATAPGAATAGAELTATTTAPTDGSSTDKHDSAAASGAPLNSMSNPSSATSRMGTPFSAGGSMGQETLGRERQRSVTLTADGDEWTPDGGWVVVGRTPRPTPPPTAVPSTGVSEND